VVDQIDPEAFSYFHVVVSGGIAFASGYASGFRLNVGALLIICILCGTGVFLAGLGFGFSPLVSAMFAIAVVALQQLGYFAAVLARAAASRTASSDTPALDAEAQGAVNPGKRGSS
jgi:hypothetical protein